MKKINKLLLSLLLCVVAMVCFAFASSAASDNWVGAWSTAPTQIALKDYSNISFSGQDLTARVVLTSTTSGKKVRFKFSNLYGSTPIKLNNVTVAYSTGESIDPSESTSSIDRDSLTSVSFNNRMAVTIPAGEEIYSDAINFEVKAMQNIAISFYFENSTEIRTMGLSGASTYIATGNQVTSENFSLLNLVDDRDLKEYVDIIKKIPYLSKFFDISLSYSLVRVVPILSQMDVVSDESAYSVCVLGDSTVANEFPLYLAEQISKTGTKNVGVLGKGLIGNTISFTEGHSLGSLVYGEPLLSATGTQSKPSFSASRLQRDCLDQKNVKYVVLKIGANDIMHPVCTDAEEGSLQPDKSYIIKEIKYIAEKVHEMGAKIVVCTITQWKGTTRDYFGVGGTYIRTEDEFEADWKIATDVNKWIMSADNTYIDGAVDTAKISKSSVDSAAFDPTYTKDYIHPNDTLQKVWAEKFPLSLIGVTDKVGKITLDKGDQALSVTKSVTVKCTKVEPDTAKNKSIKWTTSDTTGKIIKITASGSSCKITAVGNGSAYVYCKAVDGGGAYARIKVTVTTPVDGVSLSATKATIYTRDTYKLTASITPATASNKSVTWTSSNTDIATVKSGVVTAVKSGTVKITATSKENTALKATCTITIKKRVDVSLIKTNVTSKNMYVGNTYTLISTVYPTDATYPSVKWSSSNKSIATVDSNGKVTAVKTGTCYITVKSVDNPTVSVKVKIVVYNHVSGVKLSPSNAVVPVGSTKALTATVSPSTAYNKKVTYKSSDKSIAKVSSTGIVTGVGKGTCTITATTEDGKYTAKSTIQVIPKVLSTKVTIKTAKDIYIGDTYTLVPTFTPADTTDKRVSWTTSDSKIATVNSNGVVTGKAKGTAIITCVTRDTGKVAKCTIRVYNVGAQKVTLSYPSYSLKPSQSFKLRATIYPENTTIKTVKWTSSNTSIAKVSSDGTVKAIKPGTVTITCTTVSMNRTAKCKVTVSPNLVTGIKLNTMSKTLEQGKSFTLKAIVSPSNASNKAVTWKSSNTKVATVSSTGVVKAVGKGSATITCTAKDGSKKQAACRITVTKTSVTKISLNATSLVLTKGRTYQLKATCSPTDARDKTIKWTSSSTKVATVSSTGLVKAVGSGKCTIKATNPDSGKTVTCTVTIM